MISLLKSSIVITALTAIAVFVLRMYLKKDLRQTVQMAVPMTGAAFFMLSISQLLVALAGVTAVAGIFARKHVVAAGVGLFLFLTLPQIEFKFMAGSLQLFSITTIVCIAVGLLLASVTWRSPAASYAVLRDLPAYMIILLFIFINARSTSITNVFRVVTDMVVLFVIPYWMVRTGLRDAASIRNAHVMVITAALAISAVAVFESIRVWPMYQAYAQQFGTLTLANVKMRGGMLRAGGPMMNPPASGAILAMCFAVVVAARDLFRTRMGYWLVVAGTACGLFAMQTRAAWLGAVCGTLGVMVSRKGLKALAGYVPVLLIAGGIVYGAATASPRVASLVGFSSDAKESSEYRDKFSDQGIEIVKAHLLIGQPFETVKLQMANMKQGEGIIDFVNGYLSVALFSGMIGLALFVGALVLQAYNTQAAKKSARRQGAGGLADAGLGVVVAAASMLPFISTVPRIICTMLLLFVLSNSMERNFRVSPGDRRRRGASPADASPALATPA